MVVVRAVSEEVSSIRAVANGVASLDGDALLPEAQLPALYSSYYTVTGRNELDATVTTSHNMGGRIRGLVSGLLHTNPNPAGLQGDVAALEAADGFSDPLLELIGQNWTVEEMALSGPIGLRVTKSQSGLAPGKHALNKLMFYSCGVGLQIGQTASENNCDLVSLHDGDFVLCDVGIQVNNSQSMGHYFNAKHVQQCAILCEVNAGGAFVIDGPSVLSPKSGVGCTVLHVKSSVADTARNNGYFEIRNFKSDSSAYATMKLVVFDNENYANVVINGGILSWTSPQPASIPRCEIKSNQSLTIRNVLNVHGDFVKYDCGVGEQCNILFDRCRLEAYTSLEAMISDDSTGDAVVTLRDCFDVNGDRIDETAVLTDGAVP